MSVLLVVLVLRIRRLCLLAIEFPKVEFTSPQHASLRLPLHPTPTKQVPIGGIISPPPLTFQITLSHHLLYILLLLSIENTLLCSDRIVVSARNQRLRSKITQCFHCKS